MKATLDDATRISVAIYKPKFKKIQNIVSNYYGVSIKAMSNAKNHSAAAANARRVALYFCRTLSPNCSLKVIGIVNGNAYPLKYYNISNAVNWIDSRLSLKTKSGFPVHRQLIEDISEIGRLIHVSLYEKRDLKAYRHRCHMRLIYKRSKLAKL